jgi:hypothetical protein
MPGKPSGGLAQPATAPSDQGFKPPGRLPSRQIPPAGELISSGSDKKLHEASAGGNGREESSSVLPGTRSRSSPSPSHSRLKPGQARVHISEVRGAVIGTRLLTLTRDSRQLIPTSHTARNSAEAAATDSAKRATVELARIEWRRKERSDDLGLHASGWQGRAIHVGDLHRTNQITAADSEKTKMIELT